MDGNPRTRATAPLARGARCGSILRYRKTLQRAGVRGGVRIVRNDADAQDVAQDCFLRLASGGDVKTSLAGWLHRMATHQALDLKRREQNRKRREQVFADTAANERDDDREEIRVLIDETIDSLPEDLRKIVVGHYVTGHTYDVLASRLGVTRGKVFYRGQKGIEAIRQRLKAKGVSAGALALVGLVAEELVATPPPALAGRLEPIATETADMASGSALSSDVARGVSAWRAPTAALCVAAALVGSGRCGFYSAPPNRQRLSSARLLQPAR
jgi:RNA polymerase sigma factor (sigma-70 family)